MQPTVAGEISLDEELVLKAIDDLIVERKIVPFRLLKRALTGQMSNNIYETTVHILVEKRLLELAYSEGFDLGLRIINSPSKPN